MFENKLVTGQKCASRRSQRQHKGKAGPPFEQAAVKCASMWRPFILLCVTLAGCSRVAHGESDAGQSTLDAGPVTAAEPKPLITPPTEPVAAALAVANDWSGTYTAVGGRLVIDILKDGDEYMGGYLLDKKGGLMNGAPKGNTIAFTEVQIKGGPPSLGHLGDLVWSEEAFAFKGEALAVGDLKLKRTKLSKAADEGLRAMRDRTDLRADEPEHPKVAPTKAARTRR